MKKKIVVSFLCVAMMLGSLIGCASSSKSTDADKQATTETTTDKTTETTTEAPTDNASKGDMVTVSLYIPTLASYSDEAVAEVETAMNDYLAEKYGIQVDLQYIEIGNFETGINLAMTTDELDVTCYFTGSGQLTNYVSNGQLLDITDYFNNASAELKGTFTDAEIKASSKDGRMYGLVRKYQFGGKAVVVMNADMVKEMGIDPMSVTDMDSLGEVLYKVHEAYPDIYPLVPQSSADMTWSTPWDAGIGGTNFAYAEDWKSTQAKSLFELDSFAKFCSYTNKWYKDGLIMPDAISNTSEGSDLVGSGAAFACLHNADIDPLEAFYPNTVTSDTIIEPHAGPLDIGNLQYGISANSAHPEESFTLLQAIYTDPTLITLLSYGIEGKHYVINADGRATYPEGITAENEPYGGFVATAVYPNYLLLPVKATAPVDDYKAAVDDWDKNIEVSASFGYFFDTAKYKDFVTAYTNLEDKYKKPLLTGTIALEDVLPSIQSELKSIGYYDVLAELQKGLDGYLAQ